MSYLGTLRNAKHLYMRIKIEKLDKVIRHTKRSPVTDEVSLYFDSGEHVIVNSCISNFNYEFFGKSHKSWCAYNLTDAIKILNGTKVLH